jgi:hypothetical protein
MTTEFDAASEACARAACLNDGKDADETIRIVNGKEQPMPETLPPEFGVPRWMAYLPDARRWLAMMGAHEQFTRQCNSRVADAAETERRRILDLIRDRQDQWLVTVGDDDDLAAGVAMIVAELSIVCKLVAGDRAPIPQAAR